MKVNFRTTRLRASENVTLGNCKGNLKTMKKKHMKLGLEITLFK
ncbi:hypothetical protein Mcup_1330 [Metallosphaera cuprina Ar-4]|uniref:Uncharacterized protein n=1 Tax=Metallosphaera cuprina (strain Ar-4) TaxID=1006006 RepID=F4FY60_METCR|nr:hypothetical protein Mcup_1330 [Metallosphaera cuprina Ar-4]